MKLKAYFVIIGILLVCAKLSAQPGEFHDMVLGVWPENDISNNDPEYKALVKFLETLNLSKLNLLSADDIIRQSKPFKESEIIWVYKNDTIPSNSINSAKLLNHLTKFTNRGGKLVLANQAMTLLPSLGIETMSPETRTKKSADEGYGRQLGYHSFRRHSLFDGMNGGAYVLKPLKDTIVLQTGYFGDNRPTNGKVTGVDWDYIFLREESKLIIEYGQGKGKVLCIGGYLLYSMPNRNRLQLEAFTKNILKYLGGVLPDSGNLYWNYAISDAFETPFKVSGIIPQNVTGAFPGFESTLAIKPGKSIGNYWDLAGERLLLMGEDRGGITEIWAHPVMSLRDFKVSYMFDAANDTMRDLGSLSPEILVLPAIYQRKYNLTGFLTGPSLGESVTVSPDKPVAVIHYDYKGNVQVNFEFTFRALFRLMWPYSEKVTGNLYYSWNEDLQAFIVKDQSDEFVTIVGVNAKRGQITCITSYPAMDDSFKMTSKIMSFTLKLPGRGFFDVIVASSAEGFDKTLSAYLQALEDPTAVFLESQSHADSVLEASLMFDSPDSSFNEGYRWALLATDRFQVNTPGVGSSLTAGYATSDKGWDGEQAVSGRPGYGWYFGRDGEWSGFALLHYGDFEKVKSMLMIFQHYQDLNGKIFHELSTSGISHYDAADATPLYIILAGRYLRHSGDSAFIHSSWPCIQKAIDFCYSTDTDGDHLIENTNVGHGWEEGGHLFGAHTTLYLASCWAAALDEAAYMSGILQMHDLSDRYLSESGEVKAIINRDFWNPKKDYYYHGLMPDGSYLETISIMPVIPMLFGQADQDKALKVLPLIASEGFTSDWGCRIVPENDPLFNPRGYHTGSVWPLFTGWSALAEFRNNNYLQGFSHLSANLMIWKYWGLGFNEEVLNGEVFLPEGVCHHQCWSETMALEPAIEGMLGYSPDALNNTITLKPWFPADWDSVNVRGIRIGDETVSMEVLRQNGGEAGEGLVSTYFFSKSLTGRLDMHLQPVFPPGSVIKRITVNGLPAKEWGVREAEQGWVIPDFGFWLDSAAMVEIHWKGGITALPLVPDPRPGDRSKGFRIISTSYTDKVYSITLQAPPASHQEFRIWAAEPGKYKVEGAEIKEISGNIMTLSTYFNEGVMKKIFLSSEF